MGEKTRGGQPRGRVASMTARVYNIPQNQPESVLAEHAYINAALSQAFWNPGADGLTEEYFPASQGVFRWITRYVRQAHGQTPPIEVVARMWPEVPLIPGMSREWALDKLIADHRAMELARGLRRSFDALQAGDADRSFEIVMEIARSVPRDNHIGDLVHQIHKPDLTLTIPSLYHSIEVCGGIAVQDYVLILAKTSVGKSFRLMQHAVACVEAGMNAVYLSLEMSKARCVNRIHRLVLGEMDDVVNIGFDDTNTEWEDKQRLMQEWQEKHNGSLRIVDQSDGDATTTDVLRKSRPGDVVFIDYVGLMRNSQGKKMTEDWRVAADISNTLRGMTDEHGITVFAGAQANRAGGDEPDDNSVSHSLAFAQDIDLGVSLIRKKKDYPFTKNIIFKARDGSVEDGRWYTRFDPARGDFSEISPEKAWEMLQDYEASSGGMT